MPLSGRWSSVCAQITIVGGRSHRTMPDLEGVQYCMYADKEKFMAAARLRLIAGDPQRGAIEEFLEHVEWLLHNSDLSVRTESDIDDMLSTLSDGISTIENCWVSGEDIEGPLTEAVGWNYAEPLDEMLHRAAAASSDPDGMPQTLRDFIEGLKAMVA